MIETIIYNYMTQNLGVAAYMEKPQALPTVSTSNPTPYRFVVIEKTGGNESNFINRAVIAIQCYAESLYQAAALAELVNAKMENLPSLATVASCRLNNSYNFTDTNAKQYRYQSVFEVWWYTEENNG